MKQYPVLRFGEGRRHIQASSQVQRDLMRPFDCIFTPSGQYIAVIASSRFVALWDTGFQSPRQLLVGPSNAAFTTLQTGVLPVSNGNAPEVIAAGTDDGQLFLWTAAGGKLLATAEAHTGANRRIIQICFTSDSSHVISISDESAVTMDLHTFQVKRIDLEGPMMAAVESVGESGHHGAADLEGSLHSPSCVPCLDTVPSFDGNQYFANVVASLCCGKNLFLLAIDPTAAQEAGFHGAVHDDMSPLVVHNMVSVPKNTATTVYRPTVGDAVDPASWVTPGHDGCFPPPLVAAVGCTEGSLCFINAEGVVVSTVGNSKGGHVDRITSMDSSPNGAFIVTASNDCSIRVWSWIDGTIRNAITKHSNRVTSVRFNPVYSVFASASHDLTVKVWRLNASMASSTRGHTEYVRSLAFAPAGHLLVSSSEDSTCRIAPMPKKLDANLWADLDLFGKPKVSAQPAFRRSMSPTGKVMVQRIAPSTANQNQPLAATSSVSRRRPSQETTTTTTSMRTPSPIPPSHDASLPSVADNEYRDPLEETQKPPVQTVEQRGQQRSRTINDPVVTQPARRKSQSPAVNASPKRRNTITRGKSPNLGTLPPRRQQPAQSVSEIGRIQKQAVTTRNLGVVAPQPRMAAQPAPSLKSTRRGSGVLTPPPVKAEGDGPKTEGQAIVPAELVKQATAEAPPVTSSSTPATPRQQTPVRSKSPAAAAPTAGGPTYYVVGGATDVLPQHLQEHFKRNENNNKPSAHAFEEDEYQSVGGSASPEPRLRSTSSNRDQAVAAPAPPPRNSHPTPHPQPSTATPFQSIRPMVLNTTRRSPSHDGTPNINNIWAATAAAAERTILRVMTLTSNHHNKCSAGIVYHVTSPVRNTRVRFRQRLLESGSPAAQQSFTRFVEALHYNPHCLEDFGRQEAAGLFATITEDHVRHFLAAASPPTPLLLASLPTPLTFELREYLRVVHATTDHVDLVANPMAAYITQLHDTIEALPEFNGMCYRWCNSVVFPPPPGTEISFPAIPFCTNSTQNVCAALQADPMLGTWQGTLIIIESMRGRRAGNQQVLLGDDHDVVYSPFARFRVGEPQLARDVAQEKFGTSLVLPTSAGAPSSSFSVWLLHEATD